MCLRYLPRNGGQNKMETNENECILKRFQLAAQCQPKCSKFALRYWLYMASKQLAVELEETQVSRMLQRGLKPMPESMTNDGVWVLLRTNRLAMFKSWEPKAKTAAKQLKLELRKTKSILILCKSCGLLTAPLFEFAKVCS